MRIAELCHDIPSKLFQQIFLATMATLAVLIIKITKDKQPLIISDVIDLSEVKPVGSGTYRDVYPMPEHPTLMLKVLRKNSVLRPGRPIRNFLKNRNKRQVYNFMYREYRCYLDLKIKQDTIGGSLPIAEMVGLRQTSLGLAMVTERIRGKDGGNAKSLGQIKNDGEIANKVLGQINHFIAEAFRWGLVANDTNPENLMLDETLPFARFVLVDGFGDANPIPYATWFPSQADKKLNRRFVTMAKFLDMTWDEKARKILRG